MNIQRNDPETRELKQLLDTPEPEWVRERMSQVYASLPPRQESAPPLRRARRAGRTLLIVAALGCCLSLSALAASGELGLSVEDIRQAVIDRVPPKFHQLNFSALDYAANLK